MNTVKRSVGNYYRCFMLLIAGLLVGPAQAGVVTSLGDSGPGSLREAIANAMPGETISFSGGGVLTLTGGELLIDKELTIAGPGASALVIERSGASQTPDFRIFTCTANVTISGVTVRNGRAEWGGGIYNDDTLTLENCVVMENCGLLGGGILNCSMLVLSNCVVQGNLAWGGDADAWGGGIYNIGTLSAINSLIRSNSVTSAAGGGNGGGLYNAGTLLLEQTLVLDNSATGGANCGGGFGGGIFNDGGTLYLGASMVSGNAAQGGRGSTEGGIAEGGGIANGCGTVEMDRSTVSGNTALGGEGEPGGVGAGGGLVNDFGTVYATSSTISGNVSKGGAGASSQGLAYGGGLYGNFGTVALGYSTVVSNVVSGSAAEDGSGVYSIWSSLELVESILAANSGAVDVYNDETSDLRSGGFNLLGLVGGSGEMLAGPGDRSNVASSGLALGPLQDNGGPTLTHALLPGSVAIDAGDNAGAPATDQRGYTRVVNGRIDIGAYEANYATPAISLSKTASKPRVAKGESVLYTYTVVNTGGQILTDTVVTDDNGSPGILEDDFVVGLIPSLAPGESFKFNMTRPVVAMEQTLYEPLNGTNLAIATLLSTVLPSGDVQVTFIQHEVNDNRYGSGAIGWANGHTFNNLVGSDKAEFRFTDGTGKVVLDFYCDYISASTAFPSGYGCLGLSGGDGQLVSGNPAHLLFATTSLAENFKKTQFRTGYFVNSPPETAPLSGISIPAGWDYNDAFTVIVSKDAFGTNGFGDVSIGEVHNSPARRGSNAVVPTNVEPCVVSVATASGRAGATTVSASASVAVCIGTMVGAQGCSLTPGAVKLDKNKLQLPIRNNGSQDIFLTELALSWPQAVNGRLKKITLKGDVWGGGAISSPIDLLTADFDSFNRDLNRRKIPHGQTVTLQMEFEKNANKDVTLYTGKVRFGTGDGCVLTIP